MKKKTADRLTRFLFGREEPPQRQDMTIVFTGLAEENLFSADVFVGDTSNEGTLIGVHSVHRHIQKLIIGNLGGRSVGLVGVMGDTMYVAELGVSAWLYFP